VVSSGDGFSTEMRRVVKKHLKNNPIIKYPNLLIGVFLEINNFRIYFSSIIAATSDEALSAPTSEFPDNTVYGVIPSSNQTNT